MITGKFLAELINGGAFDDDLYYTAEQRSLWEFHAKKINEKFGMEISGRAKPETKEKDE